MRKSIFISALAISVLLTSCATIISGSKQKVNFTSSPSSATIYIDEVEIGSTPLEMRLQRKRTSCNAKIRGL
ncbi:PEGA domain-containing protein [Niabella ginsengisoli]|uniref:PEGA domain-containing protein n=1 Tax=Niabella ginsengisoli TaxID=522298 RepID=A0ABS9SJJ2_9BACT|nr:PEGA domain-containing protein [Niabella ginsengisoli]MCH5598515.1 PEGA domain-containing protein [Niabella ginsengisoli]